MADTYQILVVDDDFSIVNIIETALKQAGYQVLTAHDGEAACQIVNTKHPHLIIMDVMMPQCNGIIATMKIGAHCNREWQSREYADRGKHWKSALLRDGLQAGCDYAALRPGRQSPVYQGQRFGPGNCPNLYGIR